MSARDGADGGARCRRKAKAGWEWEEGEGLAQSWAVETHDHAVHGLATPAPLQMQPAGSFCGRTLSWIMEEPQSRHPMDAFKVHRKHCGGLWRCPGHNGLCYHHQGPREKGLCPSGFCPPPGLCLLRLPNCCSHRGASTPEAKPREKSSSPEPWLHTCESPLFRVYLELE